MRRNAYLVSVAAIAAALPLGVAAHGQDVDALEFFNLDDSSDSRVTYEAFERRGNAQVFTGLNIDDDGESVQIGEARLVGARETPDGVIFDSLEILNLTSTFAMDEPAFDTPAATGKGSGKGGAVQSDATSGTGTMSIDRFIINQPSARLAAAIADGFAGEEFDEDADWGKPSEYGFGTIAVEGLSIESSEATFSFGNFSLSGFDGQLLERFAFENMVGVAVTEGTEVAFELGGFTIDGLALDGIDAFAEVDSEDPEAFNQAMVEGGWYDPYKKRYDAYALEGLRVDVDGVIVGLESYAGSIDEGRNGLAMDDRIEALTLEFDDSKELGAQGLAGLQMLGYDRVEINGHFAQQANPNTDRVSAEEYNLTATDALALDLVYDIGGIGGYMEAAAELGFLSAEATDLDPDVMMQMFAPLMVHSFELRLTDDSLVERALQAAADAQGSTPEAMRQQAIAFMTIGTMMAPPGAVQTLVSEAITASSSFLEEPGTLRISINPDEPISIADLMEAFESEDYDAAVNLMNIEVVAE